MIPPFGYVALALTAGFGVLIVVQHAEISRLKVELALCGGQRQALQANADELAAKLKVQTDAVAVLEAEAASVRAKAAAAGEAAALAKESADKRIADIMAMQAPKTEIAQCRAARDLLTR